MHALMLTIGNTILLVLISMFFTALFNDRPGDFLGPFFNVLRAMASASMRLLFSAFKMLASALLNIFVSRGHGWLGNNRSASSRHTER